MDVIPVEEHRREVRSFLVRHGSAAGLIVAIVQQAVPPPRQQLEAVLRPLHPEKSQAIDPVPESNRLVFPECICGPIGLGLIRDEHRIMGLEIGDQCIQILEHHRVGIKVEHLSVSKNSKFLKNVRAFMTV